MSVGLEGFHWISFPAFKCGVHGDGVPVTPLDVPTRKKMASGLQLPAVLVRGSSRGYSHCSGYGALIFLVRGEAPFSAFRTPFSWCPTSRERQKGRRFSSKAPCK